MRYQFHKESNQHLLFASVSIANDPTGPIQKVGFSRRFWTLKKEVVSWLSAQHLDTRHFAQTEFREDGSREICFRFDTKDQAWEFKLLWG